MKSHSSDAGTKSHESTVVSSPRLASRASVAGSISVLTARLVGVGLQLFIYGLLTRNCPVEIVALYALATTSWVIARVLGPRGADTMLLRELPRYGQKLRNTEIRVTRQSTLLGLLGALGLSAAVMAELFPDVQIRAFWPALLALPVHATIGMQTARLRGRGHAGRAQFGESVVYPVVTLGVFSASFAPGMDGAPGILVSALVGVSACWLFNRVLLFSTSYLDPGASEREPPAEKEMLGAARTLFASLLATSVCTRGPTVLLAALASSLEVAIFDSALRFGFFGTLVLSSINISFSPQISRECSAHEYGRVRRTVALASGIAVTPAATFTMMIIIFGTDLLTFLGDAYAAALTPLIILSVSLTINCALGMTGTALVMLERERLVVRLAVIQMVVVGALIFPMIQHLGALGATISVAAALFCRDVLSLLFFLRFTRH